ncbi:Rtc3 protein [Pichia kluyveri]|uniref:Rtc3 protein n=1 Tax=Pichia kluyveri TaxID=36015 RepID=A0AAV5QXF0_PICKL|nr:Rtc3 protein [Pichia kluyveri]
MSSQTRVFYKGNKEDFLVFIDDVDEYEKYVHGVSSIPLSAVLANFDVYRSITGNGSSGQLDIASKQTLNEEFGDFNSVEDEIIPKILKNGQLQNLRKNSIH